MIYSFIYLTHKFNRETMVNKSVEYEWNDGDSEFFLSDLLIELV